MKKIGIFYGTTGGRTSAIVEEIEFNLKKIDHEIFNVKDGIKDIKNFDNLILISPSYGVGELQEDWLKVLAELKTIDFSGKVVGLVSLGNQYAFGETFVGALKYLYDIVTTNSGKVVGFTSTENYHFKESEAILDNKFVGLALDEHHQEDLTVERIENWILDIKNEFI